MDVDKDTMGLSPKALDTFLQANAIVENKSIYNRVPGRRIAAIVPMHTYGHPCRSREII